MSFWLLVFFNRGRTSDLDGESSGFILSCTRGLLRGRKRYVAGGSLGRGRRETFRELFLALGFDLGHLLKNPLVFRRIWMQS